MIDVGTQLKSDEMIDLLETYDLSVLYEFDRLHEGESDSYTVESEELSLALRFDEHQSCTTIFVFAPAVATGKKFVSFPELESPAEIEAYAARHALKLRKGRGWLRCDGPERCVHYEFEGDELTKVTIMSAATAP